MKRILITGGAGFIGSQFIRLLLDKHSDLQITNFDKLTYAGNLDNLRDIADRPNYSFIKGDITCHDDVNNVFEKVFDIIVNFAAETHVDRSIGNPDAFILTDIIGTHMLLKKAKEKDVSLYIQISTDEVYGSVPKGKLDESAPLNPSSPYSASKAGADALVNAYHITYGLKTIIIRFSNNFGPYQYPEKFIPLMITNALTEKKLPVYGDGKNVRDWLFVRDACEAIKIVMEKGKPGEIYHVAGENEWQNMDVVNNILDLTGLSHSLIEYVKDRLGHDRRYALKCEKVKALGWRHEASFEKNLIATIDWYKKNKWWWQKIKNGELYNEYYQKQYKNS